MSDLQEFHRELIRDVQGDADALGLFSADAFFEKMGEMLTEAGELEAADRAYFAPGSKKMQVDGYGGDPRDSSGVLSLLICDYEPTEDVRRFQGKDVQGRFRRLVEFLRSARRDEFREKLEETSQGFALAEMIATRWKNITKIKLILVTNAENRAKIDAYPAGTMGDRPVTYNVWDLARIHRYVRSGQAREDLVINFEEDFGGGVPVLRASRGNEALESFIAVVPGAQLAEIYEKWGTRLLEANVRSFLQARGKVNQKIRETLEETPEMFFAYNNGITATADGVELRDSEHGPVLISADNLQIVNGGQTTASIHAARRQRSGKPKARLDQVFVQMKLSIVPPERSEAIVPKISEYANSQNKVNAADFFSNHPFHVRMEEFSRRILAPAGESQYRETKWFYERARGQYPDERSRRTESERKKFDLEYPKAQYFTKTDLAKFENSWSGLPHMVSRGAQKNFSEFAKTVGGLWVKSEASIDETWYRRLIAKAIIFRRLEKLVPTQPWYEGGYRANIVTYTMAKIARDAEEAEKVVDLDTIWRAQAVPDALEAALLVAAAEAHDVITNPPDGVRNLSEWAKQQACWATLKSRRLDYGPDFEDGLILPEDAAEVVRSARKDGAMNTEAKSQIRVFEFGAERWKEALAWAREHRLLSPREAGVLDVCSSIPERLPSEKQCAVAIEVLERLEASGFPVPLAADQV